MKIQPRFRHKHRGRSQGGYIMLTLMLFVSLLAIAAVAIAPSVSFQIKRDREEEMIHRGVQYSRAIRKYFKKYGRYPMRIEDLESTNNLRFLRRRYKDPITGQDFKLLHFGEVQMSMGGGIAGMATGAGGLSAAGAVPNAAGGKSGFSLSLTPTSTSSAAAPQAADSGSNAGNGNTDSASSAGTTAGSSSGAGSNSSSSSSSSSPQVFGGGPIVGVTSASKAETIREFNNKNHYNQWQFIYDPGTDINRGGLINTPAQPPLQNVVANGQPAGAMGNGFNSGSSPFGSGMGNGVSNMPMGSPPPQNPPPMQPQPQQ